MNDGPAYTVLFKPSARKALMKLADPIRRRIIADADALADDPRPPGYIKLTGIEAYRVRVGDYRIVYQIHDDRLIVLVVRVADRKDIYKDR